MEIPLILKLKRESQKKIASAQDIIISTLYKYFDRAVLHGGTLIWRCYGGKRFSEDIDVYLNKDKEKLNNFFSDLEKQGFEIKKKKISEMSVYSNLLFNRENVRFECLFKKVKGELVDYLNVNGTITTIYGLSVEDVILEKIEAYSRRRKIRDLYDIFFLLKLIKKTEKIKTKLKSFISKFENPLDEGDLKILIIEGLIPKKQEMLGYIKRNI
jgi:predicted nucleotidyltransferase component of viral defense system